MSKINYISGTDKKLLNDAFLNPLKRKGKSGQELYSKRSFEKIERFYKAVKLKDTIISRRIMVNVKGKKAARTIYYVPRGQMLRPYKGKVKRRVDAAIARMNRQVFFKKSGQTSLKGIAQTQNLSKTQLQQFNNLISGQGFDKKGKLSKRMGYLYRSWVEQFTGEQFDSGKHGYGSSTYNAFQDAVGKDTFFNFAMKFIKEQFD